MFSRPAASSPCHSVPAIPRDTFHQTCAWLNLQRSEGGEYLLFYLRDCQKIGVTTVFPRDTMFSSSHPENFQVPYISKLFCGAPSRHSPLPQMVASRGVTWTTLSKYTTAFHVPVVVQLHHGLLVCFNFTSYGTVILP